MRKGEAIPRTLAAIVSCLALGSVPPTAVPGDDPSGGGSGGTQSIARRECGALAGADASVSASEWSTATVDQLAREAEAARSALET